MIYETTSTLGRGEHIRVKRIIKPPQLEKPQLVVIGWISIPRSSSRRFSYFEPESNDLNPKFVEDDLEALKRKIAALYEKDPKER